MENMTLSRTYLDSLTTADLIALADEYGIDIPEGLSRRFIIGELLEIIEEDVSGSQENDLVIVDDKDVEMSSALPKSYNETQITALLRNPAWVYVYWDLNESDCRDAQQTKSFTTFVLRVLYYSDKNDEKPIEMYDIPVKAEDRERYIFLSQTENVFRIDLVAEFKSLEPRILARSKKIIIPKGCQEINSYSIKKDQIDSVLALSGLFELCKTHYTNHRQSFS